MSAAPAAIVFDAVGTLIEPAKDVATTYCEVARGFGIHADRAAIATRFREAFARFFRNPVRLETSDDEERDRWRELVFEVFEQAPASGEIFRSLWAFYAQPESWRVFEDVPAVLQELDRRGIRKAIASNFDSRLLNICRGVKELRNIDPVCCSGQIGFCKPDSRFFAAVAHQVGCRPDELLMIGDDLELDVIAAQNCGWKALHLDRRTSGPGILLEWLPRI